MAKKDKRFVRTFKENTVQGSTEVWVDRETGVNYLYHAAGNGAGLTPLLKSDGTPVVTPINRCEE